MVLDTGNPGPKARQCEAQATWMDPGERQRNAKPADPPGTDGDASPEA